MITLPPALTHHRSHRPCRIFQVRGLSSGISSPSSFLLTFSFTFSHVLAAPARFSCSKPFS